MSYTREIDESSRVEDILEAAAGAAPGLAEMSLPDRSQILRSVAARLDNEADTLIELADVETHLGELRLRSELARTVNQLSFMADLVLEGGHLDVVIDTARRTPSDQDRPDIRRYAVPLGPVLVFAASNFPFAFSVAGGDTASAIAAGCPVIVKVHEGHPRLSIRVAQLISGEFEAAGIPHGSFATICGRRAARAALLDSRVRAAAFTGSTKAGRVLFDLAADRTIPIPFYGELGGLNPVFVTRGAILARGTEIANQYVQSVALGSGQFCTKPGLLFLPRGHGLHTALSDAATSVAPRAMLNRDIQLAYENTLTHLAQHPSTRSLTIRAEGRTADGITTTLFSTSIHELEEDLAALSVECFGPASLVVDYDDWAQLPNVATRLGGTLTATVHAEDDEVDIASPLVARLKDLAGRVIWNGWPTGVAVTPAMHHGGPYPASTAPLHTSVGAAAIRRFVRPIAYQAFPDGALPGALQDANPWSIVRAVNGIYTDKPVRRV